MQLKVLVSNERLSHVRASGKIAPDAFSGANEPVSNILGEDVYARPLLISFQGADYINSSGVSWLLICHKRSRDAGGKLVIYSLPKLIRNVLQVLRMDQVFCVAKDYAAALEAAGVTES